jgi:hypothetical protein
MIRLQKADTGAIRRLRRSPGSCVHPTAPEVGAGQVAYTGHEGRTTRRSRSSITRSAFAPSEIRPNSESS